MEIHIEQPDYIEDELFLYDTLNIEPGFTALVGCNGYGKSTLLHIIEDYCADNAIAHYVFDARTIKDKLRYQMECNPYMGIEGIAQSLAHNHESEGEYIYSSLGYFASEMGAVVREAKDKCFILIDSLDSGLSIDMIETIKDFFLETVLAEENVPRGVEMYVVVTANSYELAKDTTCIDVRSGSSLLFDDYEDYVDFVRGSAVSKMKRARI
jgi:archaellum biogenesis ATPase FlaH